jgi:hypothetical protein
MKTSFAHLSLSLLVLTVALLLRIWGYETDSVPVLALGIGLMAYSIETNPKQST